MDFERSKGQRQGSGSQLRGNALALELEWVEPGTGIEAGESKFCRCFTEQTQAGCLLGVREIPKDDLHLAAIVNRQAFNVIGCARQRQLAAFQEAQQFEGEI